MWNREEKGSSVLASFMKTKKHNRLRTFRLPLRDKVFLFLLTGITNLLAMFITITPHFTITMTLFHYSTVPSHFNITVILCHCSTTLYYHCDTVKMFQFSTPFYYHCDSVPMSHFALLLLSACRLGVLLHRITTTSVNTLCLFLFIKADDSVQYVWCFLGVNKH